MFEFSEIEKELEEVKKEIEKLEKWNKEKRKINKNDKCDFCGNKAAFWDYIWSYDDYGDLNYEKEGLFCKECWNKAVDEKHRIIDRRIKRFKRSFGNGTGIFNLLKQTYF